MQAQSVPNVTGTMTSAESLSRSGFSQSMSLQLQGANFSLNATISSDNLINFSAATQVVTLRPAATTSDLMPLLIAANPGTNNGTLIFNGITYTNLKIALTVKGAPATVANAGTPNNQFFFGGSASSVPFSVSGVVTAYSGPPTNSGVQTNPVLITVNFSGGGLYNANVTGDFPASGGVGTNGNSTYQLVANPIGFSTDATTQGAWSGAYGGEGYLIANGPSSIPGYAAVSLSQASTFTWAPQTSDARALQNGFGAATRIASSYYGNSFNINMNFNDGNPHPVALYFLDFDNGGRTETVTVKNADTGVTLDTETISNFQNGIYGIWELQGNITINVKRANGGSAVVSGIFFGPPATVLNASTAIATSSALFTGTNTAIQGAWGSHFGTAGYIIANGGSSAPTNATVSVAGALTFTWAAQTTDPRALQTTPTSSLGIASAYTQYPSKSFTINVNSPNGTKQLLSLYVLDWDKQGRAETITVTDLSTGAVLDRETVSSFQNGTYLSWMISGNVVVTVTPSGNSTPVVSGIFLN